MTQVSHPTSAIVIGMVCAPVATDGIRGALHPYGNLFWRRTAEVERLDPQSLASLGILFNEGDNFP
jgi:hypothetical protein